MLFVKFFNEQLKLDNMSRHHFASMMRLTTDKVELTVFDGTAIIGRHTEPTSNGRFNDKVAKEVVRDFGKWIARSIHDTEYPSVEIKFCGNGFVLHKTYYFIEK